MKQSTKKMGRPYVHDRTKLHVWLWHNANKRHVINLTQKEIATKTGIPYTALVKILKDLLESGRIEPLVTRGFAMRSFTVCDPVEYCEDIGDRREQKKAEHELELLVRKDERIKERAEAKRLARMQIIP